MIVRPVDLPRLRGDVVADAGQYGVRRYASGLEQIAGTYRGDTDSIARGMAARQLASITSCPLFYVAENMIRLADVAAKTLDAVDLYHSDLPAPEGLIYFERPIPFNDVLSDQTGDTPVTTSVQAASWRPSSPLPSGEQAIVITWFISREELLRTTGVEKWSPDHEVRDLNQYLFTMWRIDAEDQTLLIDGERTRLASTTEGAALATLFSVWHLMKQTLVSVSDAIYDRASRRRLIRQGKDPEPVRVITLRRRNQDAGDEQPDREFHHQWVVRGHWRRQVCGPRRADRRMIWIAPHIKGPEDAPLLGGEKVYALKR